MAINKIHHQFFKQYPRSSVLHLNEGQIVEGKIEQLYTNDKARVRIGASTLIAQIETALSVGESYYFQVNKKNNQVYLQVVQNDGKGRYMNLDNLLAQFQVKPTKVNRQFVSELMSRGIPFNRTEITQALTILNQQSNKVKASDVLQHMFQSKLPITENIYQGLATFNTTNFSTLLQSVYDSLQQNNSKLTNQEMKLKQLIHQFIDRPQTMELTFSQSLLSHNKQENAMFSIFQMLGIVDTDLSRDQVMAQLEKYIQHPTTQRTPLQHVQTETEFKHLINQTQPEIKDLLQQQQAVTRTALTALSLYLEVQTESLNESSISALKQMLRQDLLPLLPNHMSQHVKEIIDQTTIHHQAELTQLLRMLSNQNVYTQLTNYVTTMDQVTDDTTQTLPLQQQLLSQITEYMRSIGLTMEHDMMQAIQAKNLEGLHTLNQTETIKSLLVQLVQQGGQQTEQIQQLMHFINGLQLQSLSETNQMLQAQLFIPGNPLGLNDDIFMKFESKKTDNDQIDADYCRVIFMLNLEQIKETIVDMQVQKRVITVTIFNDIVTDVAGIHSMRQEMRKNLQDIDYQLSTIEWQPLSKQEDQITRNQSLQSPHKTQEGFDLKI